MSGANIGSKLAHLGAPLIGALCCYARDESMQMTFGKLFSLGIAISYAILAIHWGGAGYWKWCLGLLLPLALIWFPDEIGDLTGYYKTGYVNVQTPGVIVSILGWACLLGVPVVAYLLKK